MNGGFIFFFPDKLYFPLTFTFQVYGAKKENILVMFPCTRNKVEMSVEIEGKQNTWVKFLNTNPNNPEGA